MKILQRIAAMALFATSLGGLATPVSAKEWAPTRPVHIIVPIVGSTNDVLARLVASKLGDLIGQPVIVENKPGAGGTIGANYVAKAAPDGLTLLVGYNGPIAVDVSLFAKMPYDPVKDLEPITLAVTAPQYLAVNKNLPVKTLADLVAMARAKPDQLSYGSVAVGSASHLTMEMLKSAAKINIVHVPYKGSGPALTDLLSGNIQATFMVPGNVLQYVKQGRLKLLASTGQKRFAGTPDVPTMIESGYPDFVALSWIGFLAPAGTPKNIIDRYNREIVKILHMPDVRARLQAMEFEVVGSSPEQFRDWIQTEIPRWGKVIKDTGTKIN
ncbi:tripartite tricarboxylate transporter substrate binding protein [Paralcaligenes sp. KSB-10]|uniref:Bug family tripartite tricarboxylate transporter substrate binding protein n=1 Tax=Paralcaligenes sp. KSB-10 TaxID=2901142 RepID=UPI001E5ACC45|nr:tripartite tricarboxylate transporter substrate binding protein [Paralcaligenes sp. KSB-10]UHL63171.1 tripartite tricarboxylate transporter substrate binding protein [Paralcaligenes sp. KSB-10]